MLSKQIECAFVHTRSADMHVMIRPTALRKSLNETLLGGITQLRVCLSVI